MVTEVVVHAVVIRQEDNGLQTLHIKSNVTLAVAQQDSIDDTRAMFGYDKDYAIVNHSTTTLQVSFPEPKPPEERFNVLYKNKKKTKK
jgi:hypothetical protein